MKKFYFCFVLKHFSLPLLIIATLSCSTPDLAKFHIKGTVKDAGDAKVIVSLFETNIREDKAYDEVNITGDKVDTVLELDPKKIYRIWVSSSDGDIISEPLLVDKGGSANVEYCKNPLKGGLQDNGERLAVTYTSRSGRLYKSLIKKIKPKYEDHVDVLIRKRDSLSNAGELYSRHFMDVARIGWDSAVSQDERDAAMLEYIRLRSAGDMYTEEGKAVIDEYNRCVRDQSEEILDMLSSRKPSLATFCILVEEAGNAESQEKLVKLYREHYADKFPGCNLHDIIHTLFIASEDIAVGSKYKDFSLPDTDGNEHFLSSLIEGKIAVVEFWASWCESCRVNCRSMIPLYEKYKDSGFTFVGVAREYRDDQDWRTAISEDGYPWVNLIALEDHHDIWTTYGAPKSAGRSFLIGRDGKILKIDPNVLDVEDILQQ